MIRNTSSARLPQRILASYTVFLILMAAFIPGVSILSGCAGISTSSKMVAPSPTPTPVTTGDAVPKVYVTNGSGGLFVLNTRDQTTTNIQVAGGPAGVAFTPDGSLAYITQAMTASVAVLDTQQNAVVGRISVGQMPMAIAMDPDGQFAYTANTNEGSVSVIDTATNTVINTIFTDSAPWTLALSKNGRQLYVALVAFEGGHPGGLHPENALVVVDTNTQTIVKKLPFVTGTSLAVSPTRNELYLVEPSVGLAVIDTLRNEAVAQIRLGSDQQTGVAVSPDGNLIYVVAHGLIDIGHTNPGPPIPSSLYVISADQRVPISVGHTQPGLIGIALNPDGKSAYLLSDDTWQQGLGTIDTGTLVFTPVQPLPSSPSRIAVSSR